MQKEKPGEKPTHMYRCRHSFGSGNGRVYYMQCILIKITKNGKAKILLFGERYWKRENKKRSIRYVSQHRLSKI